MHCVGFSYCKYLPKSKINKIRLIKITVVREREFIQLVIFKRQVNKILLWCQANGFYLFTWSYNFLSPRWLVIVNDSRLWGNKNRGYDIFFWKFFNNKQSFLYSN